MWFNNNSKAGTSDFVGQRRPLYFISMKLIISILFVNCILSGTISTAQNLPDSIVKNAYAKVIREYFDKNSQLPDITNQMLKYGYLSITVDIDSMGLPDKINSIRLKYNEMINFKDAVTNKGKKIFTFGHDFYGNDTICITLKTKVYSGYLITINSDKEEPLPAWTHMSFGEEFIRYFIYNKMTRNWDMFRENKVTRVK